MAAISVIIPAYNVEKWIEKSISTLQGQTFKDYDVFIVNDGSTDRTGAIADELALSDSRINVIHQKMPVRPELEMPLSLRRRGNISTSWMLMTGRSLRCLRICILLPRSMISNLW